MTVTPIGRNISSQSGTNTFRSSVRHEIDPRKSIMDKIGELPPDLVQFARVLVAVYIRPVIEKTSGGIMLPTTRTDREQQEDMYQGKVGLIVAMGPMAYVDDESTKFHGTKNNVGDWVWFRPSDGFACEPNGVFCRVLGERDIIGKLPGPDYIW